MPDAKYLDADGLAQLGIGWELWAQAPATIPRRVSRMRLHLVFLLIRFGGLRLGEAFAFQPGRDLDCASGLARVPGPFARTIILPTPPMRLIRPIALLEEARETDFLRLDAGFCRKTFYNVAETCGIPGTMAGPRALRQARTMELTRLHVPLALIRQYLGLTVQPGLIRTQGTQGP